MLWVDLLPIFFYFILKKNKNKVTHLLVLHTVFSALTQWGTHFMAINGNSIALVVNLYMLISFLILFFIFKAQFIGRISNTIFYTTGAFFIVMYLFDLNFESVMQKTLMSSSIIYVVWSIMGLVLILNSRDTKNNLSATVTLFTSAILVYFSGSVVLFFIFDKLNSNNYSIWTVHNILEIISNLIITYAFWKLPSKSIS